MNKKELIEALETVDDYSVIVCMDDQGCWDNIEEVKSLGWCTAIIFGGGSPFSDE